MPFRHLPHKIELSRHQFIRLVALVMFLWVGSIAGIAVLNYNESRGLAEKASCRSQNEDRAAIRTVFTFSRQSLGQRIKRGLITPTEGAAQLRQIEHFERLFAVHHC
jgi:hypothetical protein